MYSAEETAPPSHHVQTMIRAGCFDIIAAIVHGGPKWHGVWTHCSHFMACTTLFERHGKCTSGIWADLLATFKWHGLGEHGHSMATAVSPAI
mmetsp:Transcript_30303/g.45294  ORF Transcript_30303/g.45294 Transcript_30303/m.45294 type:complete len:92 (-) Transcript_30303:163-438(-)